MRTIIRAAAWLGFVAILVAGSVAAPDGDRPGIFPAEGIQSVTITINIRAQTPEADSWSAGFADPGRFTRLVEVLRGAVPSNDHKCGDVGSITLHYGEGDPVVLGVLPGHDDAVYQYRRYQGEGYTIHQVDRKRFLATLKELGCPVDDPGFPG